ncbi:hypothetical protein LXA43DRAFT_395625 [Ganoderma leucocontextum]|nr:hypothetical protein LXA43DRAFT_395625 [Ganoderma leucocontextum]
MPVAGALQCLNVVWSPQILASLALKPSDLPHHLLKAFEESITRLPLRQVVFSPPHYRTNRRGLWRSALDRVFPSLKERGILQVTDRPPHRNQRTA